MRIAQGFIKGQGLPPRACLQKTVEGVVGRLHNYTFKLCHVMEQSQAFQQANEVSPVFLTDEETGTGC